MSTEILVALTALASTVLGACLSGLGKFFENWWMQKAHHKERHEKVVRAILVDYIPTITSAIIFSGSYESATRPELKEQNVSRFNKAIQFYENDVKNLIPLNMIQEMSDLNLCLDHLKYMIVTDDSTLTEKYKVLLHRTEEKLKEIKKKIDNEYR
ncbi:hypothetical protein [Planomicrobium sp. CPCC 101079]|uniref:hypothetical protein n=1 Tax=Planomicrobium sp. CPCC 101079 TaxID=2599618 RepID=UPI0011B5345C|nr:hypothetical protein [Planomicrobium sp. CPCC 101079]TWT04619.1 hypothetical protein FQV28_08425 [Planomicrobium sp. CPCC 101079]